MLASTSSPEAGRWLRAKRQRLHLSVRKVQDLSLMIATEKGDKEYYVSRSWVTDIENGKFKPSVQKLYTLSLLYQCDWNEVMTRFQIPLPGSGREPGHILLPYTHLLDAARENAQTMEIPLELRDKVRLEYTNLMSRMFETWTEIPIEFLKNMDLRHSVYAYIGKEDYTLYPVIRPSSIVQIDPRQNKITPESWHNDYDRPIYFFELHDKYVCSWCELNGSNLILIPSSQSRLSARHLRYPGDADILGRVTGVAMHLADPVDTKATGGARQKDGPRK
jgi:transcriptional regulator with XRE-family HTH domain